MSSHVFDSTASISKVNQIKMPQGTPRVMHIPLREAVVIVSSHENSLDLVWIDTPFS
jgi:hypothetical protein